MTMDTTEMMDTNDDNPSNGRPRKNVRISPRMTDTQNDQMRTTTHTLENNNSNRRNRKKSTNQDSTSTSSSSSSSTTTDAVLQLLNLKPLHDLAQNFDIDIASWYVYTIL